MKAIVRKSHKNEIGKWLVVILSDAGTEVFGRPYHYKSDAESMAHRFNFIDARDCPRVIGIAQLRKS